mmetsp:Transcript_11684/g.18872  ORF Transcript_11684/g.18872 Transcript_11684/m.18872 type:complete len:109 (+) Transcript_11684:84-410(+)
MAESPTNEKENQNEQEQEQESKIEILQNNLAPELLKEAINLSKSAFKTSRVEKDAATAIKKAFDEKIFGSTWHCVIGKHFAVSVQFDTEYFTFFKMDDHYILLFKSEN